MISNTHLEERNLAEDFPALPDLCHSGTPGWALDEGFPGKGTIVTTAATLIPQLNLGISNVDHSDPRTPAQIVSCSFVKRHFPKLPNGELFQFNC